MKDPGPVDTGNVNCYLQEATTWRESECCEVGGLKYNCCGKNQPPLALHAPREVLTECSLTEYSLSDLSLMDLDG